MLSVQFQPGQLKVRKKLIQYTLKELNYVGLLNYDKKRREEGRKQRIKTVSMTVIINYYSSTSDEH